MKYLIGFLVGVFVTTFGFLFYLQNRLDHIAPSTVQNSPTQHSPTQNSPQGFRTFYEKFHADSVFQLSHIRFPLEGIPPVEDATVDTDNFKWQQEDWVLHRPFNSMEGSFVRNFQPVGNDLVIEQIRHASANYGMQRRFAREGDSWVLIYYAAMNELAK